MTTCTTIYIVLGEKQNVYQDQIGGDFTPHPFKEVVQAFTDYAEANKFILSQKLLAPQKKSYGDTSYYRGGYYDMELQSTELIGDLQ